MTAHDFPFFGIILYVLMPAIVLTYLFMVEFQQNFLHLMDRLDSFRLASSFFYLRVNYLLRVFIATEFCKTHDFASINFSRVNLLVLFLLQQSLAHLEVFDYV